MANVAAVVEDFADDFTIGNNDPRVVAMKQRRGEKLDVGDLAIHANHFDVLADAKRLGENDRQSRDDIAEHTLRGQTDADARHADTRDQRRDLDAEFVQREHHGEAKHNQSHDAYHQDADRRFEMLLQPFVGETAQPAGDERAHGEDDERADHPKSVGDEKSNNRVLPLLYRSHGVFIRETPHVVNSQLTS